MESIDELESLCNFSVLISTNDLMIDWIEFLKTQSNNKSMLETYNLMISKLQQKYTPEFDDPFSIAENTFGIGAGQQFLPIVDIHQTYYITILSKINEYFVNKLLVLSTDEKFQVDAKFVMTNLQIAFHIPKDVVYDKEGRLSSFHNLKGKYSTWRYDRVKTKEFIDWNFNKLRELVAEYS